MADQEALRKILGASMGLFGLGALARGFKAMPGVMNPMQASPPGQSGPTVIMLRRQLPERRRPSAWIRPAAAPYGKMAAAPYGKMANDDMLGQAASGIYNTAIKPLGLHKALDLPGGTTNPNAKPWQFPGMVAGGAAGLAGGWSLVDWLANRHRRGVQDSDVRDAEQEYITAINGLDAGKTAALSAAHAALKTAEVEDADVTYHYPCDCGWHGTKTGAPFPRSQRCPTCQAIVHGGRMKDAEAPAAPSAPAAPAAKMDPLRPFASQWQNYKNLGGGALNSWLGLATLAAVPTGALAYRYVRDSSDTKALQEALAVRQRTMQQRLPSPPQLVLEDQQKAV